MSQTVRAYAAASATSPLAPFTFQYRDPRADDVVIDILYTGVCHSDLHTARNDWGGTIYPVVPGHEIVGRVRSVGSAVQKFRPGDLVGVGCMVDSCRECAPCQHHLEQYCERGVTFTYNSHDRHDGQPTCGGYAQSITVSEAFVLKVPENLDIKAVPPLLCAGITTWSPLRHWNIGAGSRVGVVGLGGLGHMAIKLAHALGAEVALFTRSLHKANDARRLGADRIIHSGDSAQMQAAANQFDLIIDTVRRQSLPADAEAGRHAGLRRPDRANRNGAQHRAARHATPHRRRFAHRRHRGNTRTAGFLRQTQHHRRR